MKLLFDFLPIFLFFGTFKVAEGRREWAAQFASEHLGFLVNGGVVGASEAPVLLATVVVILATLAQAVVPLCLVLIGMSLAYYGVKGAARGAVVISVLKLAVLPALVLATAHWGFGLTGLPLAVVVVMAALPVGSNALIFSQRYAALEAEATAAIVFSTVAFVATASVWLAVLAVLG